MGMKEVGWQSLGPQWRNTPGMTHVVRHRPTCYSTLQWIMLAARSPSSGDLLNALPLYHLHCLQIKAKNSHVLWCKQFWPMTIISVGFWFYIFMLIFVICNYIALHHYFTTTIIYPCMVIHGCFWTHSNQGTSLLLVLNILVAFEWEQKFYTCGCSLQTTAFLCEK